MKAKVIIEKGIKENPWWTAAGGVGLTSDPVVGVTKGVAKAIPATGKFVNNILDLHKKFQPECIVIHSTIKPGTTEELQRKLPIPVIYSATRGVHKRMIYDLKRYTKFFVISAVSVIVSKIVIISLIGIFS